MSVITASPGHDSFNARTARGINPSVFHASSAALVLSSSGTFGNNTTAGTPSANASDASFTKPSKLHRVHPGMDAIGVSSSPSCKNKG